MFHAVSVICGHVVLSRLFSQKWNHLRAERGPKIFSEARQNFWSFGSGRFRIPLARSSLIGSCALSYPTYWKSLSVQCNAWHWTDIKLFECMPVYPQYDLSTIATAIFVRSSSNLECRSHTWQWRPSSMINETGNSKHTKTHMHISSLPV